MDSLLASYASSSDDEEDNSIKPPPPPSKPSSVFSSLPPPKSNLSKPSPSSSSFFQTPSQPNPKPSLFSALPKPKSQPQDPLPTKIPKKIIQFRPPINPITPDDDDEDDDIEKAKQRKISESTNSLKNSSFKSISSVIPAPKNSMSLGGSSSSSSGTARRSILEADAPPSAASNNGNVSTQPLNDHAYANYDTAYADYGPGYNDASNLAPAMDNYATYDVTYPDYDTNYDQQYENKWIDKSNTTEAPTMPVEIMGRNSGKRGRNDFPSEMIEVKQDELMKNRPREDTAKLTGIAFGPSYQPVSAKGKPSKLHKRKHQIGTLYFDMRQKEMELAERRAKGFLTKAETQAKYGW
ncbi:Proline-rich protein PRCC [Heracleum sosnowskyi]|uniref:Proline-rich protein PRCC n=1 Tax=Heracleum sosnowskyi TaxID=360622 RepID=A0AAD8LYQ4_9APIA|nr:Proline-rich protein PRCC [Heracleum sosnowskyi]